MSDGISGFGTTLEGAVTGVIGQVTKLSLPGQEAAAIDVTTMDSPEAWREFIAGLKDPKQIQVGLLYEAEQAGALLEALGGDNEDWTITLPDDSFFLCEGFIQALGTDIPMDDKIAQTVTIQLSGVPEFHESDESSGT